jgi:hypothetical protein
MSSLNYRCYGWCLVSKELPYDSQWTLFQGGGEAACNRVYFSAQKGNIKRGHTMKTLTCKNVPARLGIAYVFLPLPWLYWYSHFVGQRKVQQIIENTKVLNIIALEGSGLRKVLPQYESFCS